MEKEILFYCVESKKNYWQKHSLVRMLVRGIYKDEVRNVLLKGNVIEEYQDDKPYPSMLMLGINEQNQPLHVVASMDKQNRRCYIITVYRPDANHFEDDYKTRK